MKVLKTILASFLVLVIVGFAQATTIHVPGDYPTIQEAIDAAIGGETVLVADGTYYENINFNSKAIVVMSESGPTKTTILGTGIGDVVTGATASTIQGFTITGSGDTWYDCGIQAAFVTMTIRGNIITGNWLGIHTSNYREPLIENNLIYNNRHYGIVASFYSAPTIINNTIAFNGEHGISSQSGTGVVVNNIIVFNGSNGIFCTMPESSPEILYNDVYGNQLGDYSGCESGEGDISSIPLFEDAANGDYHLSDLSPCVSAGIITPDVPDIDIEGNPRPNPPYSCPDIGAYENQLGEGHFSLTITADRRGTTDPSPGTYICCVGTEVTIEAIPNEGYIFSAWSGDATGTDNPITITMDSDKSVTANFTVAEGYYELIINTTSGGTTDPPPGVYCHPEGAEVQVEAIPDTGYRFTNWSGDASGGDNPITITMDSYKSITANFVRQYTLTIATGTGGTTDPAPGAHTYDTGTEVTITATPDTGYRFSEWTGDVPSGHENDNSITITTDSDKSIAANFIRQYTLTIAAGSEGTTSPSPGTYTHDTGTEVSITATPNSGYEFSGWSGDASGTSNPITITMDSDKSVTANFKKKKPCFIATAAYSSPLHYYVGILQEFRDKYLMPSKLGSKLVKLYYKYSPFVADIIAKQKVLKIGVRISLLPLVAFSYSMLHFGPIITTVMLALIFVVPIFFILFFRRRMSQLEAKDPKASVSLS